MYEDLDEIMELEQRPGLARVAPSAFFIGGLTGAIVAGGLVFYSMWDVGDPGDGVAAPRPSASGDADLFGLFDGQPTRRAGRTRGAAQEAIEVQVPGTAQEGGTPLSSGTSADAAGGGHAPTLQRDLEGLRARLRAAEAELSESTHTTKRLQTEIASLQRDLRITEGLLDNAREDAIYNRWLAFLESAQTEICGQFGRGRADRCYETVEDALLTPAQRERFAFCLRSGQGEPLVKELPRGTFPPDHAELLDDASRLTRDWMVVFCDKTLPITQDGPLAPERRSGTARE